MLKILRSVLVILSVIEEYSKEEYECAVEFRMVACLLHSMANVDLYKKAYIVFLG